jgi:hypothetical protein
MKPTIVLLAAGMSTRYGRLKQLEPVGPGGETLLDYAVFDGMKAGFSRVVLIIREELEEAFRGHVEGWWPAELEVVYHHQRLTDLTGIHPDRAASSEVAALVRGRSKPWGTAHALLSARKQLPGPFIILNADDFYGAEAFRQAMELIRGQVRHDLTAPPMYVESTGSHPELPAPVFTFGLITYTLRDTLSDHGGVSRGVCQVNGEGWLEGVQEVLEIRARDGDDSGRRERRLQGRTTAGEPVRLTGSEAISTNFWIFTPSVFPILSTGFDRFLESALEAGEGTHPEFLIPTVVNHATRSRQVRVKTIPTRGRFLGITHPDDRPWVVDGLKTMADDGRYPIPLWG